MKKFIYFTVGIMFGCFVLGCARDQIYSSNQAMRPYKKDLVISDHLPLDPLIAGLKENLKQLVDKKKPDDVLTFGQLQISVSQYFTAVSYLVSVYEKEGELGFFQALKDNFLPYEIYGEKHWGDVFITSYYDPVIEASHKPTGEFSQPLFGLPTDMVSIDYGAFVRTFPKLATPDLVMEQKSRKPILRGRLVKSEEGPSVIVPFYDREQIDQEKLLKSAPVLAWVRPLDSFFLQIQGSGELRFKNKKSMRVGYAAQNGHPYVPIGKFLLDRIPLEKMSMQKIKEVVATLSSEEQQDLLNKNPSYVFFREIEGSSITFFGTEVIPGRTVATDYGFFPKGVIAFLDFQKPILDDQQEVIGWQPNSRLVIDQDTGGAIRGPGRLDLYWGKGEDASQYAGVLKTRGRLYYLVPKPEFLEKTKNAFDENRESASLN